MPTGNYTIESDVWVTDITSQIPDSANTDTGGKGALLVQAPGELDVSPPAASQLTVSEGQTDLTITVPVEKPGVINIGFAHVSTYLTAGWGPDGLCVDEKGNIYQSQYGAGRVVVIDPNGFIIGNINLPVGEGAQTTNCAFGVGKDSNTLYITEAGDNVIWKVRLKTRGLKLWRDM